MINKLFCLIAILLLCSSCVSRTLTKEPGLKGADAAGKANTSTKIVWIWDKDF